MPQSFAETTFTCLQPCAVENSNIWNLRKQGVHEISKQIRPPIAKIIHPRSSTSECERYSSVNKASNVELTGIKKIRKLDIETRKTSAMPTSDHNIYHRQTETLNSSETALHTPPTAQRHTPCNGQSQTTQTPIVTHPTNITPTETQQLHHSPPPTNLPQHWLKTHVHIDKTQTRTMPLQRQRITRHTPPQRGEAPSLGTQTPPPAPHNLQT